MINFEMLKNFSQVKKYESGTIFSSDGIGTEMYVVLQGEVAILNSQDNKVITTIGPGNYFNESILFSDKKSPITSLAVTDVIALPISKSNLISFVADEPKFTVEIMKAMYECLERINIDYECATGNKWAPFKPVLNDAHSQINSDAIKEDSKIEPPIIAANNIEPQIIESANDDLKIAVSHDEFKLLPAGHTGNYELALTNDDNVHMCEIDYNCPICSKKFKGLKILSSRLALANTDNEMHRHYKDIEPVYYEVITCPNCLYSALAGMFETAEDVKTDFINELKALKSSANFKFGTKPDTATIFAEYYLALLCAYNCFPKSQLIQAKLLHRLSWIYHDCKDEQMELNLTKQALDKYISAYSELFLSSEQEQQVCMIIGELFFKLGNIKEAKNFYFKAKMNKEITVVMRRRAENRLDEIRELEKGTKV